MQHEYGNHFNTPGKTKYNKSTTLAVPAAQIFWSILAKKVQIQLNVAITTQPIVNTTEIRKYT